MKKSVLISVVTLFLVAGSTVITMGASNTQSIINHIYNDHPTPIFKADKGDTGVSFKNKDDILKIVNEHQAKGNNSSIKSAVMKTWGEHNSQDDPNNSDINFQIDPDRNVWVVITDFPNGIQTKAGFYDKATLTTVFDAESGQLLKSKVTGDYMGKGSKGNM